MPDGTYVEHVDRSPSSEFVRQLAETSPRVAALVRAHTDEHDEVLLHLLVGDIRRWAVAAFYNGEDVVAVAAVLRLFDNALTKGDEYAVNAVAISFVEDVCPWEPRMSPFIDTWPGALRNEAARHSLHR